MNKLIRILALATGLLLFASASVQAGGPLGVCNNQPLKYTATPPTVTLNYDGGGNLGSVHSKAQADAIVTNAVSFWTNVGTSNVALNRGPDLPVDVTKLNYLTYFDASTDGLNPVIYDTDGSIVDLVMGVGAKNSVLGFAGSTWYVAPTCRYAEGQAILNGYLADIVSDATLSNVITHEIGHLIGLDHTQLNSAQGLASANFPLMYPIAYRATASLHEDDVAAISDLYPDPSLATGLATVYGQLSGNFTQVNGTPIQGANIWAKENTTSKVYSVVSDYLMQGTGYFRLQLPAGTYTLHAEAIQTNFNGGSGVGPFSNCYPSTGTCVSPSFLPPLYVSGVPMTPVTLGGASTPTQIVITASCTATTSFKLDGTGTAAGCSVTPASMSSPANGATLAGATQTFTWTSAPGATLYQVFVGNSVGALDIGYYPASGTTGTSTTISGLPTDGRTLYVRLYSRFGGTWYSRDYTYTAASTAPTPASMSSPANGATLTGATQTFTWASAPGATLYQVFVGNSVGALDIGYYPASGTTGTSTTISGLPTDGRTLYVRLYSRFGGTWYSRDYTYTAASTAPTPASMSSPANGATLTGATQTFTWASAPGATLYQVFVGNSVGALDIGYYPASGTTGTSTTISGLPTDGRTLYVRLYSRFGGTWYSRDYTYTAASTAPTPASMSSPANGATLTGATQTFTWASAPGATLYQVFVGNSVGALDIGYYPASGTTGTSTTISGLPTDGRTLYVRLYSRFGGTWYSRDYTYRAGP